jgi:hypothetical protein
MTAKAIPRHARAPGLPRWVPRPREGRLPRVWAPAVARPGRPDGRMPADPLAGPVAITERAVAGDRSRGPTAWCGMAACISRYDDPAALGEADVRTRALGAGWRHDTAGRLICPYCQRRRPGSRDAAPVAGQDSPPVREPSQQAGHSRAGGISAVWLTLPAWHRQLLGGQNLRWLRLVAALVGGCNGWNMPPPFGAAVGALGRLHSAGPAGPSRSPGHRPAAFPPARRGGDDHPAGRASGPGGAATPRQTGRHGRRG